MRLSPSGLCHNALLYCLIRLLLEACSFVSLPGRIRLLRGALIERGSRRSFTTSSTLTSPVQHLPNGETPPPVFFPFDSYFSPPLLRCFRTSGCRTTTFVSLFTLRCHALPANLRPGPHFVRNTPFSLVCWALLKQTIFAVPATSPLLALRGRWVPFTPPRFSVRSEQELAHLPRSVLSLVSVTFFLYPPSPLRDLRS